MVLAGVGADEDEIALAIGVTKRTLQKHYFRELKALAAARARLKAKALMALVKKVEAGDTSAIALLFKRLDKHDLTVLAGQVADRGRGEAKPRKGKKEQQLEAAGRVAGIYAPPQSPKLQ
jgi:predicted transcriptional regulator